MDVSIASVRQLVRETNNVEPMNTYTNTTIAISDGVRMSGGSMCSSESRRARRWTPGAATSRGCASGMLGICVPSFQRVRVGRGGRADRPLPVAVLNAAGARRLHCIDERLRKCIHVVADPE